MKKDGSHAGIVLVCVGCVAAGLLLASGGTEQLRRNAADKDEQLERLYTVESALRNKNFALSQRIATDEKELTRRPKPVVRTVRVIEHVATPSPTPLAQAAVRTTLKPLLPPVEARVASKPAGLQPIDGPTQPETPEYMAAAHPDEPLVPKLIAKVKKEVEKLQRKERQQERRGVYTEVVVPGTIQHVLGGQDWDPDGQCSRMVQTSDGVFQWTGYLPTGAYEFKIARGGSWGENWGDGFTRDGPNIPLQVERSGSVRIEANFNDQRISVRFLDGSKGQAGRTQADSIS